MQWLLESPWPALIVGGLFVLTFWGAWRQTLQRRHLWSMLAALLVTAGLLVLEQMVVTETEQVENTLVQIARALEQNDVEQVVQFLHPRARSARQALRRVLPQVRILQASVSDVRVQWDHSTDPPQARVRLFGNVRFEYHGRELAQYVPRRYLREVEIVLVKHQGRYVVLGYRDNATNYRLRD